MSDMPPAASFAAQRPLSPADLATDCGQPLAQRDRPRTQSEARKAQERLLRLRLRRRAALDALLILLATSGASLLGTHSHDRLMAGLAVLSVGILLFVVRRSQDVSRLAEAGRWREDAVAGRGLTIAQWHAGAPLPAWTERTGADPFPANTAQDCGSARQTNGHISKASKD